jgi:hypothetical protein
MDDGLTQLHELPSKTEVARRLADALAYRNLSPADLTRLLGRGDNAVHKWVQYKDEKSTSMPSFFNLARAAEVLNLNIYYFINPEVLIEDFDTTRGGLLPNLVAGMVDEDQTLAAMIAALPQDMKDNIRETVRIFISRLGSTTLASSQFSEQAGQHPSPQPVIPTTAIRFISEEFTASLSQKQILVLHGLSGVGKSIGAKRSCVQSGITYLDGHSLDIPFLRGMLNSSAVSGICIDHADRMDQTVTQYVVATEYEHPLILVTGSISRLPALLSDLVQQPSVRVREVPGLSFEDTLLIVSERGYPLKQEFAFRVFQRTRPSVKKALSVIGQLQEVSNAPDVTLASLAQAFARDQM